MTPRRLAIDPARTIPLDNGWRATVAIDPDGNETLWLASPTPQLLAGCACRTCAPHDQLTTTPTTRTTRTEA
jgi:hypothetical protein